jgi:hypothetical protein
MLAFAFFAFVMSNGTSETVYWHVEKSPIEAKMPTSTCSLLSALELEFSCNSSGLSFRGELFEFEQLFSIAT